jgi:hypothetical protein
MATRRKPPPAKAAGDDPPAAAGRDDRTEQALARSREIREKGRPQIQAAREHVATARRRRAGPSVGSLPVVQDQAVGLFDVSEQIERSMQARARLAAVAGEQVQTEEAVANVHDGLAVRDSRRAAQYRQAADDARQAALRAREIQVNVERSDLR